MTAVGATRLSRPYVITGGRTRGHGSYDLPVEAMVRTMGPSGASGRRPVPEALDILELCITPCSIAEVSARLGLPLGVTRVLVADLAAESAVQVDSSEAGAYATTDRVAVLERLLVGLRAL